MTANAYRDALDRIVKVLSVPEWDSETIERVADIVAEVCDITSPITEDERIAFRNITRAWKAIGRDPMADHHDTCTCWRCECVRDVWMPINNQEKTP